MSFDDSTYIRFKTQLFLGGNGVQFPYKTKSKNKEAGTINRAVQYVLK